MLAAEVNRTVENIGARRPNGNGTFAEDISFSASDRSGETVKINSEFVRENVADLAKDADLSKFIL